MGKRLTATEKWFDPWFASLEPRHKMFWLFLLDSVDMAGLWQANLRLAEFSIGVSLGTEEELLGVMGERVVKLNGRWFVPKFITFQYGALTDTSPIHRKVSTMLRSVGIDPSSLRLIDEKYPINRVSIPCKDKENKKEKTKDKKKEKEGLPDDLVFISGMSEAWAKWESYRNEIHKPLSATSRKQQFEFLRSISNPVGAILESIRNGWTGLFEPKQQRTGNSREIITEETVRRIANLATAPEFRQGKGDGDNEHSAGG